MDNLPKEIIDKINDYRYGDKETNKIIYNRVVNEIKYWCNFLIRQEMINNINHNNYNGVKLKFNYIHEAEEFMNKQLTPYDLIDVINCNELP